MIEIKVTLDSSALLASLSVQGHAGFAPAGNDVVCAAVSVLVRTAGATLSGRDYIEVTESAPSRGEFYLDVAHKREGEPYLSAVQDFLFTGLRSIAAEYPKHVTLFME